MINQDPLQIAIEAARAAGALALGAYRAERQTHAKGDNDIVTEVDLACEEAIVSRLLGAFPDDAILAEERGSMAGASRYLWVIDPLDGTHNYAAQLPFWCISIARFDRETQRPDVAAIYDSLHDELFTAQAGAGAWLNGVPIRVSPVRELRPALVACDLGYVDMLNERTINATLRVRPEVRRLRILGSAVVALAYVAVGRLDAFYHTHLQPWDLAAGWLLLEEAGGCCTLWDGGPIALDQRELLASNGHLHAALSGVLCAEAAVD